MCRIGIAVAVAVTLGGGLGACQSVTTALSSPTGQLFCAVQAAGGGSIVVGLIDDAASLVPGVAPIAVLATNALTADVSTACASAAVATGSISGIPVSPPPAPSAAPLVAIAVPAGMPTSAAPKASTS